jgi:hypothetical protein
MVVATLLLTWSLHHHAAGAQEKSPSKLDASRTQLTGRERQLMLFEQYFAQEEVDRHWAAHAIAEIEAVVVTPGKGSQVKEVRCATTLCRVVATHDSHMEMRMFTAHLAKQEPFRSQPCSFFYDTHRFGTIAFIGRLGYRWPEIDVLISP